MCLAIPGQVAEHIPRVQEAHASAYHLLRELVERP